MTLNGGGDSGPRFAVGTVLREGLAITWQHLFRFAAIVVAIVVPVLILTVLARTLLSSGVRTTGTGSAIDFGSNTSAVLFVVIGALLAMLGTLLIQAAIVTGTLQAQAGRRPEIGACLSRAFSALPSLLLAGLLLFVGGGVAAGVIGFVVLQLMGGAPATGADPAAAQGVLGILSLLIMVVALAMLTLFWVFVPALVVERAGPVASFKRSLTLTKGRRGSILGIVLLLSLANLIASGVTRLLMANGAPLGGAALNLLAALFFMVLAAVLSAVGYRTLRAEKEGGDNGVARVFD